jgi:hypothetical protein
MKEIARYEKSLEEKPNMPDEVYNAFVRAGFGSEANRLSKSRQTDRRTLIEPALGHYIAVIDRFGLHDYSLSGNQIDLYDNAMEKVSEFIKENIYLELADCKDLHSGIENQQIIKKFVKTYSQS